MAPACEARKVYILMNLFRSKGGSNPLRRVARRFRGGGRAAWNREVCGRQSAGRADRGLSRPVSYTHLTLPTKA